jgi:hypothetical protein
MPRRNDISKVLVIVLLLGLNGAHAFACTWAAGYFHRVRTLKGHVVGARLGPVNFRWLRQSFDVSGAELTLYLYPPQPGGTKLVAVKSGRTDSHGRFDFGNVAPGHYWLEIHKQDDLADSFEVEITTSVPETADILIDISPITPDCKGGHEFNVQTVAKQ